MNWFLFPRRSSSAGLRREFDLAANLVALLDVARTWNKPRGLTWESVHATGDSVLVRTGDREPLMLVPVEVHFGIVPGSDMEDVPQASDPRQGTALFFHIGGAWRPGDRIMLNLTPAETLERNPLWTPA